MKLYLFKTNQIYDSLNELLIQSTEKNYKKQKDQQPKKLDQLYQFFYQGKQFSEMEVKQLIRQNSKQTSWIIVNKIEPKKQQRQKVSYDSHRQVIQRYIKETKTNQKQKIRQNAEFIFQNAIDGNFKYHSFEYFELEKQFTEERKAQLLNKVFWKLCEDTNEVSLVDRKKENQDKESKDQKKQNQQKNSLKMEESKQQSNKYSLKNERKMQEQHQELQNQQKKSQQILQLHELEYINQNWKQLLCVNKYLLKTNLDNLEYYDELSQKVLISEKKQQHGDKEKMQIENNVQEKMEEKSYDSDIEI